jgi:hypothetical protein
MTAAGYFGTGIKKPGGRGKAQKSLDLIAAARAFLSEAHPTSVRGVAYHLFTTGIIRSMAKSETAKVSRLLTDAREAGTIPWAWLVDETRRVERDPQWTDPEAFVATVRESYRRDFWAEQPVRVEVWSEKGTVRGILAPVLSEYGVGFQVMHGFASATSINNIAEGDDGRPLVALYVGDWDPSGLYMSWQDLPDRLARYGAHHVAVDRVALTVDDVLNGGLPSFPASDKRSDPRYRWFRASYGDRCWEIDAMHPTTLRDRVRDAIRRHIEPVAWARCARAQEAETDSLQTVLDTWPTRGTP